MIPWHINISKYCQNISMESERGSWKDLTNAKQTKQNIDEYFMKIILSSHPLLND
jgi:hypothetical protein